MNLTAMLLLLGLRVGKNAENVDGNLDLEQCLIEAINYFTNFGETLIVPTSSNNLNLKKLSAFNKLMVLCTDHVEIRNENVLKIQRDVYIIEFGTYQELQTILNNMKIKKFWNLRSKFLLIFYGAQTEDAVEQIFKFSWQSNIYDLMLVLFRNSQTPNIFLWYPYFPTITKIDSCEFFKPLQKKLSLTEVPKMLIPRPLKVEVVIFPPYVISHDSGSDIRIVKELAAAMGTQASVNHSDIPFNFGIVLPDKTVSGMFGAAYYERVDMAIGGFILQPDKYALLDASYPYHNEFYYWCVPRAHKLPSWKQVFDTMNLETWILILLAYIVFTMVLWSLSSIRRQESFYNVITNCFFNIFAIFIGANVGVKPKSTFVRFFVFVLDDGVFDFAHNLRDKIYQFDGTRFRGEANQNDGGASGFGFGNPDEEFIGDFIWRESHAETFRGTRLPSVQNCCQLYRKSCLFEECVSFCFCIVYFVHQKSLYRRR
jgi:hypothetical protein